jgi:hypothetical protein
MFAQRNNSSSVRFIAAGALTSLFALTFLLFGREQSDVALKYIIKTPSHSEPRPHCPSLLHTPLKNESWEFIVERDGNNHGLSEEQCRAAFPKLFVEIDKSASLRTENKVTFKDLDSRNVEDGMVRGIIDRGEVCEQDQMGNKTTCSDRLFHV